MLMYENLAPLQSLKTWHFPTPVMGACALAVCALISIKCLFNLIWWAWHNEFCLQVVVNPELRVIVEPTNDNMMHLTVC